MDRKELLDQLQVIRDRLTEVMPGYDGAAGEVFAEIDAMENLIEAKKTAPVDWTAQC